WGAAPQHRTLPPALANRRVPLVAPGNPHIPLCRVRSTPPCYDSSARQNTSHTETVPPLLALRWLVWCLSPSVFWRAVLKRQEAGDILSLPGPLAPKQHLDLVVVTPSVVSASQRPEGKAPIVIRVPVVGIDGEGLGVGMHSRFELTQIRHREPEIVVCVPVRAVQRQRLTIVLNRPLWVTQATIRNAT